MFSLSNIRGKGLMALFALLLFSPLSAKAEDAVYTGTFSNKAVSGYDTVAYFTEGKPVKGSEDFQTEYKGATWLFSSAANLEAFKANPDQYAPQYGGYCAYALAKHNALVSSDPEAWYIQDGKLYLNYDQDVRADWLKDKDNYITNADANWPGHFE